MQGPEFSFKFAPGGVEVVRGGVQDLTSWHESTNPMSFWRLYWNRDPGAVVHYDGQDHALNSTTVLLVAPGTAIATRLAPDVSLPLRHLFLIFRLTTVLPGFRPGVFPLAVDASLRLELERLLQPAERVGGEETHLNFVAVRLICGALAAIPASVWEDPGRDSRVRAALQFMKEHTAEPLTVEELARKVGMTPPSFIRLFRREIGKSPYQYLILLRHWRSRELLATGRLSTEQVAESCGFSDRNHFARSFRNKFGFPPAEWRKRYREGLGWNSVERADPPPPGPAS